MIDLAVESGCSGYDCEFVALAEALNTRLVTSDRRLLKAFPRITVAPTCSEAEGHGRWLEGVIGSFVRAPSGA